MSPGGDWLFGICGSIAVVAALTTVIAKSPLRAAVGLLVHVIALAGIFLTLHAHLLAALQLLVYAGAVVVLFIFVIMMIGPSAKVASDSRGLLVRTVSGVVMALLTSAIAFATVELTAPWVRIAQCADGAAECRQFGSVESLGMAIYQDATVPFELVSILLLVAVVGAIAIARGRSAPEKEPTQDNQAPVEVSAQ